MYRSITASTLGLLTALGAQETTVTARSGDQGLVVSAILDSSQDRVPFPARTALPASPFGLFASRSSPSGGAGSGIYATFETPPNPTGVAAISFDATGGARTGPISIQSSASGDVIFTFHSPRPVLGTLHVQFRGTTSGTGSAGARVDIGNDQSDELVLDAALGSFQQSFPTRTDATGLAVKIAGQASASLTVQGSVAFVARVELEFVPRLRMLPYGSPCPHGLTGSYTNTATHDTLGFRITGAASQSLGALALGLNQLDLPLPPTGCRLLVDPVLVLPLNPDATGGAYLEITVPQLLGPRFFAQSVVAALENNLLVPRTSNGLEVQ